MRLKPGVAALFVLGLASGSALGTGALMLEPGGWLMVQLDQTEGGDDCEYLIDYEITASGVEGELLGILLKEPRPGGGGFEDLVTTRTGSVTLEGQAHWIGTCTKASYFVASNGALNVNVSIKDANGVPYSTSFVSTGSGTTVGTADFASVGTAQLALADAPVREGWAHIEIESEMLITDAACAGAGVRAIDARFPGEETFLGLPKLPSAGVRAFAVARPPPFPFCAIGAGFSNVASALGATHVDAGSLQLRVASVDVPADVDVSYANVPMTLDDYPPGFFHGYYWMS